MTTSQIAAAVPVAEICLYGAQSCGSGYLARTQAGGRFGTGDLVSGRSMTEAVWLAVDDIRQSGVTRGVVQIFAAGGERVARVDLGSHVPTVGELPWRAVA